MALIEMCGQMVYGYATQDLSCKKCQQIQRSDLDLYCTCSGNWGNKETVKSEEDDQWNKRIVEKQYNLSVPLYKTTFLSPNQIGNGLN